jgi:hypothetical protein
MAATSLKLPDPLKRSLAQLAKEAGTTPHAYMVDALAREVQRAQLRARFVATAAKSEREAVSSGKAHSLDAAFEYLEAKLAGKSARPPRARAWRASK